MANKVYTDQQMQWGAQLGYYNYKDSDIDNYHNQVNADDYPTLQYVLKSRLGDSNFLNGNIYSVYCHHVTDYYLTLTK